MTLFRELKSVGILVVERTANGSATPLQALGQSHQLEILAVLHRVDAALAWLDRHAADVMVTDLALSDGCGLALVAQCARRHPACKILVLVDDDLRDAAPAAINAGASGFLIRGSADSCVAAGVLSMLDGGCPISARGARPLFDRYRGGASHFTAPQASATAAPAKQLLTRRETQVLELIVRGDLYQEISGVLGITLNTLQTHIKSLYRKLDVHSRSEASYRSRQFGLFPHAGAHSRADSGTY